MDVDCKAVSDRMVSCVVCVCVNWIQLAQGPSRANRDVDLSFEKSGTTNPTTRRHIPEDLKLQVPHPTLLDAIPPNNTKR